VKAVVVYESLWGNTAAIAKAIAEGIGPEARALTTDEANHAALAGADLIVAGAPVLGFSLASEDMRKNVKANPGGNPPAPPDISHPALRTWLESIPSGRGRSAAFETRIWWSPGGATGPIEKGLASAGYSPLAKRERFIVTGRFGPLRQGEVERARAWGEALGKAAASS
jgi:hypothetical protein